MDNSELLDLEDKINNALLQIKKAKNGLYCIAELIYQDEEPDAFKLLHEFEHCFLLHCSINSDLTEAIKELEECEVRI